MLDAAGAYFARAGVIYVDRLQQEELATATRGINRRGGDYLWVLVGGLEGRWLVIFSSVPLARRRGIEVEAACGVALLAQLLEFGIETRRSSQGWPLPDGERARRTGRYAFLGLMSRPAALLLQRVARGLHAERSSATWPVSRATPPGVSPADVHDLYFEAQQLVATDHERARRLARDV